MDEYNDEINNAEVDINCDVDIKQKLNPWFSIWIKPRKTIQYIINDNPRKHVILLAIISGIIGSLDNASSLNMGDNYPIWGIFVVAILGGSLGGICYLYLFAALINGTGRSMEGKATTEYIRIAIAWGEVPYIVCSILWIPELILFGEEMFSSSSPTIEASLIFVVFSVIQLIVSIWSAIVFYKCLGEVQGYSAWNALWNCILAGLVIAVPLVIIAVPLSMIFN